MYFFGFVILMNVRHFNLKRNQEQTKIATNGFGVGEVGKIRALQPNP